MVLALATASLSLCGKHHSTDCRNTGLSRACRPSSHHAALNICRGRSTRLWQHQIKCSAGDFEEGELIKGVKAGDRLKVKESRIVWHSPKHKEGLDLKGKEGTIIEVIDKLNGKPLSANLPYKTQFLLPLDGGKEQKLIAHLAAGEFDKM